MKKLIIGISLPLCLVGLWVAWVALGFLQNPVNPNDPTAVLFSISSGQSVNEISENLAEQRLISNARHFRIYVRLMGQSRNLRVGEYQIETNLRPYEVLAILTSGRSVQRSITFIEGLNIFEVAEVMESHDLGTKNSILKILHKPDLAQELLAQSPSNLEGYLFPDTYAITKFTTAEDLIREMLKRFEETYTEVALKSSRGKGAQILASMDRHAVVTLASIIEKETGAPEERPLISSVFHNRLNKRMRLQTDPTVIYGMWIEQGSRPINLRRKDLKRRTPYNTYMKRGLPPGPIANPGEASIEAALEPAESKYLYFVSRNDGTHQFSRTYQEHQQEVRKFQLNPRARHGKSWRDRLKSDSSN